MRTPTSRRSADAVEERAIGKSRKRRRGSESFIETDSEADGAVSRLQDRVQQFRNLSAAGSVGRNSILNLIDVLNQGISDWDAVSGMTGLGAYAQAQKADPTLNIAQEFVAMRAAAISLRDWINNNFPVDGSGVPLVYQKDPTTGELTELEFTSAQLSGFRTEADAFLSTVS